MKIDIDGLRRKAKENPVYWDAMRNLLVEKYTEDMLTTYTTEQIHSFEDGFVTGWNECMKQISGED